MPFCFRRVGVSQSEAAHAAKAEEEGVALNAFRAFRHASEAAGRRPPVQRAQRATDKALYSVTMAREFGCFIREHTRAQLLLRNDAGST